MAVLLERLAAGGPLLFIGLMMTFDPVGFAGCFVELARVVRLIGRGFRWESDYEVSRAARVAIRSAGICLSAFAWLVTAGLI
jgi:hypothetical protein